MPRRKEGTFRVLKLAVLVLVPVLLAGPVATAQIPHGIDAPPEDPMDVDDTAEWIDDQLEPVRERWSQVMSIVVKTVPWLNSEDTPEFPEVSDYVVDEERDPGSIHRPYESKQEPLDDGPVVVDTDASFGKRVTAGSSSTPAAETAGQPVAPLAYAALLAAGFGLVAGPLSMYRRVKKSQALDNDVRESVYKFVENNPGATVTEIAEGVGVSHSTATYHVKILGEFDLISKRRDGNSLHIFPSDAALDKKEALLLSYMRDRETREIIRSVYANPWTYPSELARSLDMSRSSAQWHLEKLEESGIVETVRDGKFSYLYIDPEMKDTVEEHLVQ